MIKYLCDLQEKFVIEEVLKRNNWDLEESAKQLKRGFTNPQPVTVSELINDMKRLGIVRPTLQ